MTDLIDLEAPPATDTVGRHNAGPVGDPVEHIERLVESLETDPRFVHRHRQPAEGAHHGELSATFPEELLRAHPQLWSHQAEAIDALDSGSSVVVATPTASGKSACYQLPALRGAMQGTTTLVVYPTKALAHDQLRSLTASAPDGVVVAAYDGDCSANERSWVRDHADVVLTNPEMLHLGILANHRRWDRFLNHLDLVVLDEIHTLRGVFGSHVAHLVRRLRRLVRTRRGTEPRFVLTSATIGEPERLASELTGTAVHAIERSGAPAGSRTTVLWNPYRDRAADPRPDATGSGSLNQETARIAAEVVSAGLRTLVFCRSRRASEVVANQIRGLLAGTSGTRGGHAHTGAPRSGASSAQDADRRVRTYRAGYLSEERREIEAALGRGTLDCVVATNALELGVDIEGLDAVVLSGFPGTISSFRQQCGRVGRSARSSLAVLVAGEDQLDQWMMRHPRELFRREPEPVVINPDNHHVLLPHVGCAADEMPLRHTDGDLWGEPLDEAIRELVLGDRLRLVHTDGDGLRSEPRAVWSGRGAPAPTIGLRSASRGEYRIRRPDGSVLGTVDASRAELTVHTQAVYLHQGTPWRVIELDHRTRTAHVVPDDGLTYTQTRSSSDIRIVDERLASTIDDLRIAFGRVEVTSQLTGFERRSVERHELIERCALEADESVLDTEAIWWTFDQTVLQRSGVHNDDLPGALHAAEHAAIGILPLFALCDRWDVGGVSTPLLVDTGMPTVVIHDALPGGSGVASMAYRAAQRHLAATLDVLESCRCANGCPSCVQSPKCGNGNEPLDKDAAAALVGSALHTHHQPFG